MVKTFIVMLQWIDNYLFVIANPQATPPFIGMCVCVCVYFCA